MAPPLPNLSSLSTMTVGTARNVLYWALGQRLHETDLDVGRIGHLVGLDFQTANDLVREIAIPAAELYDLLAAGNSVDDIRTAVEYSRTSSLSVRSVLQLTSLMPFRFNRQAVLSRLGSLLDSEDMTAKGLVQEVRLARSGDDLRSAAHVLADYAEEFGYPAADSIREILNDPPPNVGVTVVEAVAAFSSVGRAFRIAGESMAEVFSTLSMARRPDSPAADPARPSFVRSTRSTVFGVPVMLAASVVPHAAGRVEPVAPGGRGHWRRHRPFRHR